MIKGCTVNHCALLHLLESGGNRTQDQPISALHATDGFRAHGNLTPSVDGGSLQRKCFKVGVLNFALFNMESKRFAVEEKVLLKPGTGKTTPASLRALPRGQAAESTPFSSLLWENSCTPPHRYPHTRTLICRTPSPHPSAYRTHENFAQHGFRVRARAPRRQRCRERV